MDANGHEPLGPFELERVTFPSEFLGVHIPRGAAGAEAQDWERYRTRFPMEDGWDPDAEQEPGVPVRAQAFALTATQPDLGDDLEGARLFDFVAGVAYEVAVVRDAEGVRVVRYTVSTANGVDVETVQTMPRTKVLAIVRRFLDSDAPPWGRTKVEPPFGSRGNRAPSPDAVAQVYREAVALRDQQLANPLRITADEPLVEVRKYVAEAFGARSPRTADHWIAAARRASKLPKATTGRGFRKDSPNV